MSTLNNSSILLMVCPEDWHVSNHIACLELESLDWNVPLEKDGKRQGGEEQRKKDNYDKVSSLSSFIRFYPFLPTCSKTLDTQCLWWKLSDTLAPSSLSSLPSKPLDCNSSHRLSPLPFFFHLSNWGVCLCTPRVHALKLTQCLGVRLL